MESSVLPMEFNGNADRCIIQSAVLQSVQSNVSKPLDASATGVSIHECFRIAGEKLVIQQSQEKDIVVSGSPNVSRAVKQQKVSLSTKSNLMEAEGRLEHRGGLHTWTVPRYLNLEPSLAMDWLEISWDELHIKERVGAGTLLLFLLIDFEVFLVIPSEKATKYDSLFLFLLQVHLELCIVLNGMDLLVVCSF